MIAGDRGVEERLHIFEQAGLVERSQDGLFGEVVEKRHRLLVGRFAFEIGGEAHLGASAYGALRLHIELAQAVNLIAKELDADWVRPRVRKHIEDAAAPRQIAGLIHEVRMCEPLIHKALHEGFHLPRIAGRECERIVAYVGGRRHAFAQRLNAGDDDAVEVGSKLLHHIGAGHERTRVAQRAGVVGRAVGRRKAHDALVGSGQVLQVALQVGGIVFGGHDAAQGRARIGAEQVQEKCWERACGALYFERTGRLGRVDPGAQIIERGCRFDTANKIGKSHKTTRL